MQLAGLHVFAGEEPPLENKRLKLPSDACGLDVTAKSSGGSD